MSVDVTDRIRSSLDAIRPYLQADGGDVEFIRFTDDGFVEVRLTGACISCPMSRLTLRAGVERRLLHDIPDIRRVEQVFY